MGVLGLPMGAVTHTILDLGALTAEAAIVATVVAGFVGIHAFLQRRLRTEMLRRHNDVAGYLFSAVGVLYAVVLGFVVVVVWQKYDTTVSNVQAEVNAAADLYHVTDALSPAVRDAVRDDIRRYAQAVVGSEWPAMAANRPVPDEVSAPLEDATYRVDAFASRNFTELAAQQAAIRDMAQLLDARRTRLIAEAPAVPGILWFALVAGALAMIAFCYIFGVESRPAQLLMTGILVGFIGILFIVIAEFATPFSGSVRISDDGWTFLLVRLQYLR